jgi:diguanylate cyclase (GGDEF)-like protein/PAS domain S-box-containing protein
MCASRTGRDGVEAVDSEIHRANLELRHDLAEIQQIYRYAPVGLCLMDKNYRFVRINERMAEINGRPIEAHLGRTLYEVIPDLADRVLELYRPVYERGEAVLNVELQGATAFDPGTPRHWLANFFPFRSDTGDIIGLIGAVVDITERKQAELAVRDSEERFRTIFDSVSDGILILDLETAAFLQVNRRGSELFGYTSDELLQLRLVDLCENQSPDAMDAALLRIQEARSGIAQTFEWRAKTKDGDLLWIEVMLRRAAFGGCDLLLATMHDITDRKRAEERVRQQKLLLDSALENMSQGLCMFDADGRVVLFNERYTKMMGLSAAFLKGRLLVDVIKSRKANGEFLGDPIEISARVIAGAGEGKSRSRVIETLAGSSLRLVEQPMRGGGWVATFEDITSGRKAQAQISHMARHDALTNLPNRTLFREQLEGALCRVTRKARVAVLCLDLDHFKDVNDSLGHPIGDALLIEVARRLSECVRSGDTVSRLGGDEFAVIQTGSELQELGAAALAGRIIEAVGAPYVVQGQQMIIGTSIGISVAPDDGIDPDQLLKNADMALYRAKADSRGTYRFFETGMDARAQARRLLELDLRAGLLRGEFEVYYQPIFDLKSNQIVCFEALLRWNHPLRGMTSPIDFIPLAEETGLIVTIGAWVLRKACADAAGWSRDVSVAVNLSPVQFKNRNLVPSVTTALSASGLAANRLELEITETVLLQDSAATLTVLHRLRDLGIRISMDDFGTGYSSLSYLHSFLFDKIKIDQSFVQELALRGDSMAIVRAVTGLGKSLGISTTAEGVETNDQLALLRKEGCTEVQGYLFSAPRPAAEVEKMLSDGRLSVVA